MRDGRELGSRAIEAPTTGTTIVAVGEPAPQQYSISWSDGGASLVNVSFEPAFDEAGERTIEFEVETVGVMAAAEATSPVLAVLRRGTEGGLTRVALLEGDRFEITREVVTTDLFGGRSAETRSATLEGPLPGRVTAWTADASGANLYAGTHNGFLLHWNLAAEEGPAAPETLKASPQAVTALGMVLGDLSIAVGDDAGGLATWSSMPAEEGEGRRLARTHVLAPHAAAVERITKFPGSKTILSIGADGRMHLDHMTSERHLVGLAPESKLTAVGVNGRGDALIGAGPAGLAVWRLENPHPEVSWKSLFGKVWYESYAEPDYVWQSTAATVDFEPKLSLVPLIFGTFKGTFYAMLFALPLAVLGALYTSQFMRPGLRRWVKPGVEVMAAVPSVVVGFLAALWLAPLLEHWFVSLLAWLVIMPVTLVAALLVWQSLQERPAVRRWGNGFEFAMLAPLIGLGALLAVWAGPWIEGRWMGGSFSQWLYEAVGERYDQRNAVVIAFGLGFAVIPIIFTIAEDSLSNIPRHLTAASLALGASRWQTAWRVVLPSASPGIFAGAMIGFGRAVGETMIVLMATGNTAIMEWNPFNGMRTLSANIAVEIPEAPVDGTLYRVLFLTAVILFLMTFVVNTLAEVIRQRLRKKYGQS